MNISRNAFDRLVEAAIAALPTEFARWIDDVPVMVEDRPGAADHACVRGAGGDDEPLGMFIGLTRGNGEEDSGALPARVMLYREPLMKACKTRDQLADEIRRTLIHELGHYAGMDERDLEVHGFGDMADGDEGVGRG